MVTRASGTLVEISHYAASTLGSWRFRLKPWSLVFLQGSDSESSADCCLLGHRKFNHVRLDALFIFTLFLFLENSKVYLELMIRNDDVDIEN